MKVLVTTVNSRMALCISRILHKKGYEIIVADFIKNSMCFYSNKINKKILSASPYSFPEQFIDFIKKTTKKYKVDYILPVHEETFLFSKNKEKFNDLLLPIPEYDPLLKVHNKDILYDILQSLSILTPKTYPLSEFENFDDIRSKISGRIILKPRQGGGNWGLLLPNIKNSYSSQINNYLKSSNINPSRILVQEWIPVNEKFSHVVIYQHGKLVQDFGTCAVVL